jgi:hypothetical protein
LLLGSTAAAEADYPVTLSRAAVDAAIAIEPDNLAMEAEDVLREVPRFAYRDAVGADDPSRLTTADALGLYAEAVGGRYISAVMEACAPEARRRGDEQGRYEKWRDPLDGPHR